MLFKLFKCSLVLWILLLKAFHALSVGISFTRYEDENLYLQIYPYNLSGQEVYVKCLDLQLSIDPSLHLSTYNGLLLLRANLGPMRVKTATKIYCSLVIPEKGEIYDIPAPSLLGFPRQNSLPASISWSPVTEIDPQSPSEHYTFTDEPLAELEEYEKIYQNYTFDPIDPRLREANWQLKEESKVKIFLTMTTSPSRLKLLHYTLRSMNFDLVDAIFITLPRRFKDTQNYEIPSALLEEFPQIRLLSEERDFGPISKIASAVQFVHETYDKHTASESIFISIDDDNMYSDRLVDTLAYHSFTNPESIVAAAAFQFFQAVSFGIHRPLEKAILGDHLKRVSDLEGFAGVAYRGRHVDYKLMKFLADKKDRPAHRYCYFSDDVVISNVVQMRNIQILRLPVERGVNFYSRNERLDLPHFRDENSLHLTDEEGQRVKYYQHLKKYQLCQMEIAKYFIDFESSALPFKTIPQY